jgi:hypothetical protein
MRGGIGGGLSHGLVAGNRASEGEEDKQDVRAAREIVSSRAPSICEADRRLRDEFGTTDSVARRRLPIAIADSVVPESIVSIQNSVARTTQECVNLSNVIRGMLELLT